MDIVDIIYYIVLAFGILYIIPLVVCIIMNEEYGYDIDIDNYIEVIVTFFSLFGICIIEVYELIVKLVKHK